MSCEENWLIKSNREAGDEFADLIIYTDDPNTGIVIEVKFSDSPSSMEYDVRLCQIEDKRYEELFVVEGIENVKLYGISFYRKRCKVIVN